MAYVDMTGSTYFYYKALLTYQNMQQLAANDEYARIKNNFAEGNVYSPHFQADYLEICNISSIIVGAVYAYRLHIWFTESASSPNRKWRLKQGTTIIASGDLPMGGGVLHVYDEGIEILDMGNTSPPNDTFTFILEAYEFGNGTTIYGDFNIYNWAA